MAQAAYVKVVKSVIVISNLDYRITSIKLKRTMRLVTRIMDIGVTNFSYGRRKLTYMISTIQLSKTHNTS